MVNIGSLLLLGAVLGSLYALISLGFTLILSLRGVVNLAYGAYLMFGAFTYFILSNQGIDNIVSIIAVGFATGVLSLFLYYVLVRFIEGDEMQTFLSTFLITFIVQELYLYKYGNQTRLLRGPFEGSVQVLDVTLSTTQIVTIIVTILAIGLFGAFIRYTATGQAIIAMSLDEIGAVLVGVNTPRVNYITWFLSGAMAGIGGIFLGVLFGASPTMWLQPLLIVFAIVIVGGIGSIIGTVITAFLVGYIQTLTVSVGSPAWQGIFIFALLIGILMIKPTGFLGREVIE
jgi:branched-chain amino acid transport system permease protein